MLRENFLLSLIKAHESLPGAGGRVYCLQAVHARAGLQGRSVWAPGALAFVLRRQLAVELSEGVVNKNQPEHAEQAVADRARLPSPHPSAERWFKSQLLHSSPAPC